jgi:hypothetical protein
MAQRFDIVYPPKGRALLDGGLNTKFERSIIADNESPECLNVVFSGGAVETRMGSTKLNTAAIGTFVIDGLYTRRDNTTAETMVAFAGGSMWQLAGTSFTTVASAQSVFSAGVRVGTTQYENHMFIGNGTVTPYKYNGAHFTRHGVPRAVSSGMTGTVSATGGSGLSGTYLYKVAYVNSAAVYGDVSTATAGIAVTAGNSIEISAIPVAPASHGVNARRIYRASGAAGTFELISTINDNTTTTLSDTGLTASTAAPTDNGEPPVYSVACTHQGRLFVNDTANPGYLWYSNIFEPYTFASTNFQPVGDQSRDLIKSLEVYDNCVVIGCENSVHLLYMPDTSPANWSVIKIRTPYGTKSPFANFLYNNKLMFGAMQNDKFVGFAAISGSSIDPEATTLDVSTAGSDLKSDRIEPDMFDVQEAYVRNISSMVFKNKAYITVTDGANSTTNNRIYIFDFSISNLKKQEASWAPLSGLNAAQFTVYGGSLYYGSSTATGFVYKLEDSGYADDSAAINSYFWTKEFSGLPGHENLQKDFREIRLLVQKAGAYFMGLTHRLDSDKGDGVTQQIDLNPGSTLWNGFFWGQADWGGGTDQEEVKVTLGQVSGKRIQLKFSNLNTSNQRFKVHGLNIRYNIKGKR